MEDDFRSRHGDLRQALIQTNQAAERRRLSRVVQGSYLLRNLPVEILIEIFNVLISEHHTWSIKLSHVCGHWRRILINTPSAWRTLVLSRNHPLQKAKVWKERAENRITRILADVSEPDSAPVFAQLRDLYWNDLSCLQVSGNAFTELHRILSDISLPHTFSNLDELHLFAYGSRDHLSCCLSGPAWKLKILHLTGVIRMVDEWWQRIQQLKELHLDGYITHFSTLVFTANPSLEILSLSCLNCNPEIYSSVTDTPTSMNNLKTIECRDIIHPFLILRTISAPSITHFRMYSVIMSDEVLLHIASRPSLVELCIGRCSLRLLTLRTLLSSTPNLEILKIISIRSVVNGAFQFLTPNTANSVHELPCRALKHIDVSYCSDLTMPSVYAFVKTRKQYASESVGSTERCAVVESLKVDGCPNIQPDMLPWFKSNVAQFSCKARKWHP